ncbi:MAG: FliM/FliN family flagellar motor switch protein [Acidimicrobiales bacterium]|nr:MAG: FliM/FliN family flagellar motor switch protein [Acidimicrobiales bacterium]
MNVIQKKSKLGLEANASSPGAFAPWEGVHHSLCEYVSKEIGADVIPKGIEIDSGSFKNLAKDMTEDLLSFSFGDADRPTMSFACVAPTIAKALTDKSLGVDDQVKPASKTEPKVGLLELLLMAPCAEIISEAINAHIALLADDMSLPAIAQTSQRVGLTDFEVDREMGDWVKLVFPFEIEEQGQKSDGQKQAKKQAAKDQPEPKAKTAFYIFLPKNLMEAISIKHNLSLETTEFDPTEPWAIHMREAVDGAGVSIKAVLETCDMSVAECTRLSIGQVIPLPGVALQAISLETDTQGGAVELAASTLGTYKANRAVQLTDDIRAEFISDLSTLTI